MNSEISNELIFPKILLGVIGIFSFVVIMSHCYHEFMIKTTEQIPASKLPTIGGVISKVHHCRPAKNGWINRVEVLTFSGSETIVYTPCLVDYYPKDSKLGKSILVINEKFNFPTFVKEGRILLVVDNVVFQEFPKYRSEQMQKKSIALLIEIGKIPTMIFLSIVISLLLMYGKVKQRVLRGLDRINELRSSAENSFAEKLKNGEIISRTENFNVYPKYGPPLYSLDIYFKSMDGFYWRFKSDGVSHKIMHIDDNLAKIKWPNK